MDSGEGRGRPPRSSPAGPAARGLKTLVYVESLRSGPTGGLLTTWSMQAPDKVEYRISGGADAIVLGTRRWDRDRAGAPWRRSRRLRRCACRSLPGARRRPTLTSCGDGARRAGGPSGS